MRAGGVCDVNSLTGLIPPACPNDQTLANLEDSQVASWECGGYWCTGKWDTVGTHRYSREGQMRGCFMVWAADHVRREKGLTRLINILWIWRAYRGMSSVCYSFLFLRLLEWRYWRFLCTFEMMWQENNCWSVWPKNVLFCFSNCIS